jgi:6-pyruvoyltetrahydropterin/6-carboxytetrahydropterin synthase
MTLSVLNTAIHRFAAARSLPALAASHPYRALHGHNFLAGVWCRDAGPTPADLSACAGLHAALASALRPIDPGHLNECLAMPGDVAVAHWLREQLAPALPGLEWLALQSTPQQGVRVDAGGADDRVWRRYRFEAAHQLMRVPPGHKCGRMHGHGFSVVLEASAQASPGSTSLDYDRLDQSWLPWFERLHGACLNQLSGLENPTSEMLARWLWERLRASLADLCSVTVYETATCGARYDGQGFQIWKDFSFDSAVQEHGGLNGHTYLLRLLLSAPLDEAMGWTVDYGDVKSLFQPTYLELDHQPLHEIAGLAACDSAGLATWLFGRAKAVLPSLEALTLFETPGQGSWVSPSDWRRCARWGEP